MVRLILLVAVAIAAHAQPGSWGDQGDGTYNNPILNADYPDVDIEKVGDTFYMITSTNHYAPGMTLLESRDLVNWTIIGHVFDKLDWKPVYNYDQMGEYGKGVWAGDIAYHDGKWYCYFIDHSFGLYVSTAGDIRGPWTPARLMLAKSGWTDPAVYWDEEERQAYLIANFGSVDGDPSRENHQRVFKMSWDGLRLLDEGRDVYQGPGAEAAKIYKINGEFHVFLVEWRRNDRLQLDLRGPTIYGPFERRVLLRKRDDMDRSTCQGALVEAGGKWWFTHQLVQHRSSGPAGIPGSTTPKSYEGRSQWLIPVRWEDGWPVLGDGNHTVDGGIKPLLGYPITAPQTDDDFSSPRPGPQWQWNHNPRDDGWSLTERPGWLRLKASVPVNDSGFWNASNTISQRIMGKGGGVATAKVDISGMKPGQQAGFLHHSGKYVMFGLKAGDDGVRRLVFNENGVERAGPRIEADVIYFRTDIYGARATFSYRTGPKWKRFGPDFELIFGRWRGDRIGFYCWNDERAEGHIDIDWFRYHYDGPNGAL